MNRTGIVFYHDQAAGVIEEAHEGYRFTYDPEYLNHGQAIAHTLPLQEEPFMSTVLFPFFQGLLPEGWYREITCRTLKIDEHDEMGLLLATCSDCIGAVSIRIE